MGKFGPKLEQSIWRWKVWAKVGMVGPELESDLWSSKVQIEMCQALFNLNQNFATSESPTSRSFQLPFSTTSIPEYAILHFTNANAKAKFLSFFFKESIRYYFKISGRCQIKDPPILLNDFWWHRLVLNVDRGVAKPVTMIWI